MDEVGGSSAVETIDSCQDMRCVFRPADSRLVLDYKLPGLRCCAYQYSLASEASGLGFFGVANMNVVRASVAAWGAACGVTLCFL